MHWQTPPEADSRTWLALERRGRLAPGHRGEPSTCPACARPAARSAPPPPPPPPPPPLLVVEAPPPLSVRDKIVATAASLAAPFTVEDLVVACWERFPESFSLGEYEHPHSNRVLAKLAGVDGLVAQGWLRRVDGGLELTRSGRRKARTLGGGGA